MTEIFDRYRRAADGFGARVHAVPDGAWDHPAPCEGWVARDVVGHLCEWLPAFFFGTWEIEGEQLPSVADDPVAAWDALDRTFTRLLGDPEVAGQERDTPMGPSTFEQSFDMIATSDIVLHTWDLARATGLDERLDPQEVHQLLVGMEPMDEVLRQSGHYGPRVEVADDADEQTRLLAFIGRHP